MTKTLCGLRMARILTISNTNQTEKDLLDQAFEDGIGYNADRNQLYVTSLVHPDTKIEEEDNGNSVDNSLYSSRLSMHRYFNSTTLNKQYV